MEKRYEILQEYTDVHIWLLSLAIRDNFLFGSITQDAIKKTASHFKLPYSKVNELITGTTFQYTKDEIPIVFFFSNTFVKFGILINE